MACFTCKHGQVICDDICPMEIRKGACSDCDVFPAPEKVLAPDEAERRRRYQENTRFALSINSTKRLLNSLDATEPALKPGVKYLPSILDKLAELREKD